MTMASRDIANMHLFLDLKKKFPDLPDETLRSYISLFVEDQEKCIKLLQKECENHYHPSQPFSDFRLPESKVNFKRNDYVKNFVESPNDCPVTPTALQHSDLPSFSKKLPTASSRSKSHAGVLDISGQILNPSTSSKPYSAPVITSSEKPFTDFSKQTSVSSHSTSRQNPNDRSNQMIFSTTKQYIIEPPVSHESKAYLPISGEPDSSRKSAVKLSITPSFPFQHQQVNVFSNPVCSATTRSRPGCHTTTLSFQLQPHSSSEYPLEISTIPTNLGSPSNSRDFGSHVQVSVGAQGATFTALRLQHPSYSQTQSTSQPSATQECLEKYSVPSSHTHNSSEYLFPNSRFQPVLSSETSDSLKFPHMRESGQSKNFASGISNAPINPVKSYELSPNYILAVKNHQIAQFDLIHKELEKEKLVCAQLREEVKRMELEVSKRAVNKSSFPYAEELHKLREEIRSLRVECNCLSMEVDSAGQIPLGVTDEDFYSNIFTGPNGALTSPSNKDILRKTKNEHDEGENKPSNEDEENDINNSWTCKRCTFANHPALEKCELCELPKNSEYIQCNTGYSPSTCLRFVSSSKDQPRRTVGSVQISVTRRVPSSSKSVKLQLTHRLPR